MLYLRSVAALSMPIGVDVVVPALLLSGWGRAFDAGVVGWVVGAALVAAGAALLLDSVFLRFAREGRGTLAPIDPPRFVVRGGPYRVVRNPMYVANVAVLVGIGLLAGSWLVLIWAVAMWAVFHAFVVLYEEPGLRRRFGEDYLAYCRRVGRWLPRARSAGDATGSVL